MKQILRYFTTLIPALIAVSLTASAQYTIATGYFNDGYVFNHKLNPALRPNMSYCSIPLTQISVGTQSNLKGSSLLYKLPNGSIGSFMHPDVPASTVLNNIAANNTLNANLNLSVLSFGWYNEKGNMFTNIDFETHAREYANLPYDFFALAKGAYNDKEKYGEKAGKYNLGGIRVKAYAYSDISVGQSYAIGADKNVKIGYKVKFLLGMIGAEAQMETFDINSNGSKWDVTTKGNMYTQQVYFASKTTSDGRKVYDYSQVRRESGDNMLGNYIRDLGFGVDFGVSWDINEWMQVSACVQDLGMIKFVNTHAGVADNHYIYPDETTGGSTSEQMNQFLEMLGNMAQYEVVEEAQTDRFMIPWTLRAGAQVRFPMYDKLSLGALYSQQFFRNSGWWEVRGSLNYDALRWLALSVSYAASSFGGQFGAMLNIHSNGIAFHIGADNIPLKYTKQGIPLDTGTVMASVGLAFQFGSYHGRYPKKLKINN